MKELLRNISFPLDPLDKGKLVIATMISHLPSLVLWLEDQ